MGQSVDAYSVYDCPEIRWAVEAFRQALLPTDMAVLDEPDYEPILAVQAEQECRGVLVAVFQG